MLSFATQLVAEGSLQSELTLEAIKWEVRAMGKVLTQNERMLSGLRDADAAEASNERQLRHNLQEDARQALGEAHIHESYEKRHASQWLLMLRCLTYNESNSSTVELDGLTLFQQLMTSLISS